MNNLRSAAATFAIIFLKELRHAFRDKDVLIYTFVVPAVIYPMLLVGGIEMFIMKQEADARAQTNWATVGNATAKIKVVQALLDQNKRYKRMQTTDGQADLFSGKLGFLLQEVKDTDKHAGPAEAADSHTGHSEAADPHTGHSEAADPHTRPAEVTDSHTGQAEAVESTKLEALVPRGLFSDKVVGAVNHQLAEDYKTALNKAFKQRGLGPAAIEINKVEKRNLNADKREMFSMAVALLFFSLFNVALGAAYPAIAATSEEFERNTIEAILVLPVNRWFVMTAKLFAVATMAMLAGTLNLASMAIDSSLAVLGADSVSGIDAFRFNMSMSLGQASLVLLAYVSIVFLYSSLLMMTASFCRTVRSSQQWISFPLGIFMLVPVVALTPSVELTKITAMVPMLNNLLVLRSLYNGESFSWLHLISFLQTMILVAVAMKIASVLVFERFEGKWRF